MKKRYRKAIFIVVYRRSKFRKIKYLLFKRKLHWIGWEFPKGGVRTSELDKRAITREVKEETGQLPLSIARYPIHGRYEYLREYPDRPGILGQTYSLYSAEVKNQKIKMDKLEHSKYKWLSFKKAMKTLTWSTQRRCLRAVNNFLTKSKNF